VAEGDPLLIDWGTHGNRPSISKSRPVRNDEHMSRLFPVALVLCLAASGCSESTVNATGSVKLYRTIDGARKQVNSDVVATLSKDESARVVDCIDLKSVQVVQVEAPTGALGYLVYGDFVMSETPSCRDP
jgi:hypothetical protein